MWRKTLPMTHLLDACCRGAFRVVYPLATLWWRLYGNTGIFVAIWVGEQVLLVRHSYKPGLRLPSGGVWSGEDHCLAAVRELHEEVGLTVAPDDLHLVSTFKGPYGMNYLYEAELATKPNLVVDRREIVAANFAPADMARERHQFVRRYLKARARLMRR
jgi:8-oxo-dGTP pyrophosphatase MutT (NUDIX family)